VDELVAELEKFQSALRSDDGNAVEKYFANAKQRRDNWCAKTNSTSTE
jgi:hypothetical protein